jgi:hypothetical protein
MRNLRYVPGGLAFLGVIITFSITHIRGFPIYENIIRLLCIIPVFYLIGMIFVSLAIQYLNDIGHSDASEIKEENDTDTVSENMRSETGHESTFEGQSEDELEPIAFRRVQAKEAVNHRDNPLEE